MWLQAIVIRTIVTKGQCNLMKKLVIITVLGLITTACATPPINFAGMSEAELLAYNRGKPVMEQIYCEDRKQRTGTHIRRTDCRTVEDWVEHNFRTQQTIQTMAVGRPFN